jgi:hypothetical protein
MSKEKSDEEKKTLASEIFSNSKLINERPEGMGYYEYRYHRSIQTKVIKHLFKSKPDKKLLGLISEHKPLVSTSRGFTRPATTRKQS